jgi:hypothetical protein
MNGSSIAAVTNKYAIDCQDNSHFMGWQDAPGGGFYTSTYTDDGIILAANLSSINLQNCTIDLTLNFIAQRMSLIYSTYLPSSNADSTSSITT